MDLEIIMLNQTERQYDMIITYMQKLKNDTNKLTYKWKQTHRHRKQIYGYQRGKGVERNKLGVWD